MPTSNSKIDHYTSISDRPYSSLFGDLTFSSSSPWEEVACASITTDPKTTGKVSGAYNLNKPMEDIKKATAENNSVNILLIADKNNPPTPECIMENEKNGAYYTTVKWNDGTYTTVKASGNDQNEKSAYIAFCAALAKKLYGTNSKVHRMVDRHMSSYLEAEKKKEAAAKRQAENVRQKAIERKKIMAEAKCQRIKKMAKDYNAKYFAGPIA